ncbi:LicD family protein [Clostridium sartagoforme]|uniref:LicD family protein n=1 Tax=Clostridium sartagoforme TaxID=84031 RepID=A0A4S2DL90_9CLOT|nr:LicD family protein [Clostridium sartagoforme]TGY42442.1 LicD family protein [Clostridium sartagoforme]
MDNKENLSEIQEVIWNIAKYIKMYLDDNKIEYYMLGGTLLGAIRHKGFIPWDDDIDLGIPRKQYEEFINNVQKSLPEYLKLQTFRNEKSHHYYFARVVDTRHTVKRTGSIKERNEDIWVDIFPLDGMPNKYIERKIHMFKLLFTRMMYHISCFDKVNLKRPNRPLSERIIIKIVQITKFGQNSDMYKWLEKIDSTLRKYPYESSNWVINFMGQYKFKEMFPKSYYGKGQLYSFEDSELPGPVDADAVLSQMYGDYMTPPEEGNRNAHAVEYEKE